MPFEVFRRHQRKLMAFLAIFAMVAFTLDFSLFRTQFAGGMENPKVVELYGRPVYRSDLAAMQIQRSRANRFMSRLLNVPDFAYFGGLDDRSLVDALILQREADRLGIPATRDLAIRWLRQVTDNQLTTELFDRIYHQFFAQEVTDTQLLEDIANQIRINRVRTLPGPALVTPLDVYNEFRAQNERVSVVAVPFRVEEYLAQVPQPSDAEVKALYEEGKDRLPDPASDKPGFKIPQRIVVEYVSVDTAALNRQARAKLTEEELRAAFKARPDDFPLPAPELPTNLFAGDPDAKLTPRLGDPFEEVREQVAETLAREKTEEEVARLLGAVRDEVFSTFSNEYGQALDENQQAKEEGRPTKPLPTPGDRLKQAATKYGLTYEKTPALDRQQAEVYGPIAGARLGGGPLEPGVTFAEEFFDPKRGVYEELELADNQGRRFLVWKIEDQPARVPTLDEARDQVVQAWRMIKARELAQKAALALAEKARAQDGDLRAAAGSVPIITTSQVPRKQPGLALSPTQVEPARESEIPEIPYAGQALRDAYFSLKPKEVTVEANAPRTVYYVMALNQSTQAPMATLYSPFGPRISVEREVQTESTQKRIEAWMSELRLRAGLRPDWVPPDELAQAEAQRRNA